MPRRFWMLAVLVVSLSSPLAVVPAGDRADKADSPGGTGVMLYEISERVTFDPDSSSAGVIRRNATAPLQGFAEVGTPLCPSSLLISVPRLASCTVIAIGTDSVSTVNGAGPVAGTFDVVVNAPGNSSVHVPDLPVISGTFTGGVDLSLAVLRRVPLGSSTGSFTITQIADPATVVLVPLPQPVILPFKGTFRMPFAIDTNARPMRSNRMRAAFLPGRRFPLVDPRAADRALGRVPDCTPRTELRPVAAPPKPADPRPESPPGRIFLRPRRGRAILG